MPEDPDNYVPFSSDPTAELAWSAPRLGHRLEVWEHQRVWPDGRTGIHYRVSSTALHPGVAVLPVTSDGRIGMQQTWRPVIGEWVWETPRGFGETSDPLENAARELREEARLTAHRSVHVGHVYGDSGLLDQPVDLVIAYIEAHTGTGGPEATADDATELRNFTFFDRATGNEMIRRGELRDGTTLALLAHLDARAE